MKNLVVTTGDWDGIGLEISYKALKKISCPKSLRIFVFFSQKNEASFVKKICKEYPVYSNLSQALQKSSGSICFVKNNIHPAKNFEGSVVLAKKKEVHGIVTAPLSKSGILKAGLKDRGHTDIIRRHFKSQNISMAFLGNHFSVSLVTDHIPLSQVPKKITSKSLEKTIQNTWESFQLLSSSKKKISVGVLGLNPHAGEVARIGQKEDLLIQKVVSRFQKKGLPVFGPLVPDTCFSGNSYKKHSVYIAMYHDQGLIPFKIFHKTHHGIQISLNAPFVRTSVDHGTAKDIFGTSSADPSSMVLAIQTAIKMLSL